MRPRLITAAHAQRGLWQPQDLYRRERHSAPPQSYTERMEKTGRPISPHVTILLPHHRYLFHHEQGNGRRALCWRHGHGSRWFLEAMLPASCGLGHSDLGQVISLTFLHLYHYICGIRHVVWDKTVKGFDNESMEKSSTLVLGAAAAYQVASRFYQH